MSSQNKLHNEQLGEHAAAFDKELRAIIHSNKTWQQIAQQKIP